MTQTSTSEEVCQNSEAPTNELTDNKLQFTIVLIKNVLFLHIQSDLSPKGKGEKINQLTTKGCVLIDAHLNGRKRGSLRKENRLHHIR